MPEPVLVSIAAALAGKAASSLLEFVRQKFSDDDEADQALDAADGAAPDSPEVLTLAERLAQAERDDPDFGTALREEWNRAVVQQADHGGVTNQIHGEVTGKVVQARDIGGGVSF
jgi:hypothetical protein